MRKKHVLLFCVFVIIVNAGLMQARPVAFSSNNSPELSERLGIDEDFLRTEMTLMMKEDGWVIPWLILSTPWFIVITMILLVREAKKQENIH